MNLIVNVDSNWAIGYRGKLLVSIPEDMKFFRSETTGKVVVLGRKTLDTFPGGQPLKNRTNIILTRNPNYQVKGAIICHSVEEVLEELKKYNSADVYIIGGDSIYKEFLPYFRKECSLEEVIDKIKLNTRHYAKRQLTWFKRDKRIKWYDPQMYPSAKELALEILKDNEVNDG